jgi:hypothetical protein
LGKKALQRKRKRKKIKTPIQIGNNAAAQIASLDLLRKHKI